MKLCQFNGLVLFTQRFTEFDACDSFEVTETQTSSVICCPPVLNGNMNIYLICNNPVCKKKKNEIDCTRQRSSCGVFSMFQEAFVKEGRD